MHLTKGSQNGGRVKSFGKNAKKWTGASLPTVSLWISIPYYLYECTGTTMYQYIHNTKILFMARCVKKIYNLKSRTVERRNIALFLVRQSLCTSALISSEWRKFCWIEHTQPAQWATRARARVCAWEIFLHSEFYSAKFIRRSNPGIKFIISSIWILFLVLRFPFTFSRCQEVFCGGAAHL